VRIPGGSIPARTCAYGCHGAADDCESAAMGLRQGASSPWPAAHTAPAGTSPTDTLIASG
jgi:hypothetical protein